MQNRITAVETTRGGGPYRMDEILVELLTQYEHRYPTAQIAVIHTPVGTIDSLSYPGEITNVS